MFYIGGNIRKRLIIWCSAAHCFNTSLFFHHDTHGDKTCFVVSHIHMDI